TQPPQPTASRLAAAVTDRQPDAAKLASAMLDDALAGLGAVTVAIWRLAADGAIELAGQAGVPGAEASAWRRVPPGVDILPSRAVREQTAEGGATWWLAGQPDIDDIPVMGPWRAGARAVLPFRRHGFAAGALEVCWPEPIKEFTRPMRRQLMALADLCAQALGTSQADAVPAVEPESRRIMSVVE